MLFEVEKYDEEIFDLKSIVNSYLIYNQNIKSISNIPKRLHIDCVVTYRLRALNKIIAEYINVNNFDVTLVHTDRHTEAPFILRFLDTPSLYFDQEILAISYSKYTLPPEKISHPKSIYENLFRKTRKAIDYNNAKNASHIATLSKYMANYISHCYDRESTAIYPGVYTSVFRKSAKTNNNLVLYMGHPDSIWCKIAQSAVDIIRTDIKAKLEVLYANNNTIRVSNDRKLAKHYSSVVALLCTLPFEAFGLKVIESMACETPVLAVNEGGYRETVIDGVTGFLLPRDPKLFAEKIEWLIDNPEEARRMGKAGREHVKKNFTWEKHNKCLEKLLIETANAKK